MNRWTPPENATGFSQHTVSPNPVSPLPPWLVEYPITSRPAIGSPLAGHSTGSSRESRKRVASIDPPELAPWKRLRSSAGPVSNHFLRPTPTQFGPTAATVPRPNDSLGFGDSAPDFEEEGWAEQKLELGPAAAAFLDGDVDPSEMGYLAASARRSRMVRPTRAPSSKFHPYPTSLSSTDAIPPGNFESEEPDIEEPAGEAFPEDDVDPREMERLAAAAWKARRVRTRPTRTNPYRPSLPSTSTYPPGNFELEEPEIPEDPCEKWQRHMQERSELPVRQMAAEVLKKLNSDVSRVCCIVGEAGCGKSTQIPQLILEDASSRQQPARIVVTQPRRVAALALARRVAYELSEGQDEELGKMVGYRIGGESKPGEFIDYCTVGYLLQLLVNAPRELNRYTHIVLDEVHERSSESDMLCLVVKLLATSSSGNLRLVVMSATLQAQLFSTYFAELSESESPPETIHVGGRCHPVEDIFLDEFSEKFGLRPKCKRLIDQRIKDAFTGDKIKKIDQRHCEKMAPIVTELIQVIAQPGTTILVFLPGMAEISAFWEEAKAFDDQNRYRVFPLHSMIPREEQEMVFQDPLPHCTNVVLATDIAESSVTLPHVVAVVDLGLHRRVEHDIKRGVSALTVKYISQASAKQRGGRAGRTRPGICLRFYTRHFFENHRPQFDLPESCSMPLDTLYLQSKQLAEKLRNVGKGMPGSAQSVIRQMLQAPELDRISRARAMNSDLGSIEWDDERASITNLGHLCLQLPILPQLARLVWFGVLWGCAADAVVLVSVLSANDPFSAPSPLFIKDENEFLQKLRNAVSSRLLFDGGLLSEPLMLRQLFVEWLVQWHKSTSEWAWGDKESTLKARRRHTKNFSYHFSLSRGRMEHMVSHVLDISLKTHRCCAADSKAGMQLESLINALGYHVNDRRDLSPLKKNQYTPFVIENVFEEDPDYLKSLVAAAFNDSVLVGSYSTVAATAKEEKPKIERQQKLWKAIKEQGLPPDRTIAFNGKEVGVDGYFENVCGSPPEKVVSDGVWTFVVTHKVEDQTWNALDSRQKPREEEKCRLPHEMNLLHQFEKSKRDLQKVQKQGSSGWGPLVKTPEHPCILNWEWVQGAESSSGASVRCTAMPERRNSLGIVGYVPEHSKEKLDHVLALAVASSAHSGENVSRIFPDNVTMLSYGHIPFIIACAKHEKRQGFEKFGFSLAGALTIGPRCVDLPKKCIDEKKWEMICGLRDLIREQLVTDVSGLDQESSSRGSSIALGNTPVEDAARRLLANVNLDDPAVEAGLDQVPAELQHSTVSLAPSKKDMHHVGSFQPLPAWKKIKRRRDKIVTKKEEEAEMEREIKKKRAAPGGPFPMFPMMGCPPGIAFHGRFPGQFPQCMPHPNAVHPRMWEAMMAAGQCGMMGFPPGPTPSQPSRLAPTAPWGAAPERQANKPRPANIHSKCEDLLQSARQLQPDDRRAAIQVLQTIIQSESMLITKKQGLKLKAGLYDLMNSDPTSDDKELACDRKNAKAILSDLERQVAERQAMDLKSNPKANQSASSQEQISLPDDVNSPSQENFTHHTDGNFTSGQCVRIHGLEDAPELNDAMGVLGVFNSESGRWIVKLSAPNHGEKFLCRENIRLDAADDEMLDNI